MKRRRFISCSGALVAAFGNAGNEKMGSHRDAGGVNRSPVSMKLGCQSGPLTDEHLQFFKRHSVDNICVSLQTREDGRPWNAEMLMVLKDRVARLGVSVDMVAPPFLGSTHIDQTSRPAIMLGKSPERDRDIEEIQALIRDCAKVGIPAIKYNLNVLGVVRTGSAPGRGGSLLSSFRLADAGDLSRKTTRAGRLDAELFWERITYFLQQIVPVANEYKIRMACHPHDPGLPEGFEGVDCVLGSVDGLKKFIKIYESPYHGLNFCQGTVCEMLEDPSKEIFDVIRYFGIRRKIFNVHFRNIRGHRDDFRETFPDDGDVDLLKAMLVYKEVGYPYMVMPDHVPRHKDDPSGLQAFSFSYGYIRALLHAVAGSA